MEISFYGRCESCGKPMQIVYSNNEIVLRTCSFCGNVANDADEERLYRIVREISMSAASVKSAKISCVHLEFQPDCQELQRVQREGRLIHLE